MESHHVIYSHDCYNVDRTEYLQIQSNYMKKPLNQHKVKLNRKLKHQRHLVLINGYDA